MQSSPIQVSVNVRFLLWKRDIPRQKWAVWLGSRCSWDQRALQALMSGKLADAHINEDALLSLTEPLGIDATCLRFDNLIQPPDELLQENLRYLLNSMERGGKKTLATALAVDPTTISRWLNGSYIPKGPTLGRLVDYFGLPRNTDLRVDPIFLSVDPVSIREKRLWLHCRLDALDSSQLRELYPALYRLLEER